jgi:K+/H+ antiporter YhaU regulatory subunit KhtT
MVAMLVSNRTAGFLEHMLLDDSHDCRVEQYTVNDGCRAADRTIGELRIRSRTGVSIFCVLRKDKNRMVFNPPPSFTISSGDILFFIANPQGKRKVARILDGQKGRGTNE